MIPNALGGTVPFNGSYEESFACGNTSVFTQQELNRAPLPIDSTGEVRPSPSDADVGFIHVP
jgi:hypothetical protein